MRHIHVELPNKKAPLELPAQEGDLPPTTAPAQGLDAGITPGAPRHFGQEEMRPQRVYQVSVFSQLGGFSTSTETLPDTQRSVRLGVKRGPEETQWPSPKHPLLGDTSDKDALEGVMLCGPVPDQGVSTSTESLPDTHRPVRLGVKRGPEETQWPSPKHPLLGDTSDKDALEGVVLCGPAPDQGVSTSTESLPDTQRPVRLGVKRGLEDLQWPSPKRSSLRDSSDKDALEGVVLCGPAPAQGMGLVMSPGVHGSVYSYTQLEQRDTEGGVLPRSPPLSPNNNPSRRPTQHSHDRAIHDAFAPLSPKSPPICDPHGLCDQGHSVMSTARTENPNGSHTPIYSLGSPGNESCSNGTSVGQPSPHIYEMPMYETPNPASPTSPPGPFSPPHHTELQEPGEATEWKAGLESSPPERSATQAASSSSTGLAFWVKTPSTHGHRLFSPGHCQAKRRLLSPPDTGELGSEDEGPSTSKRSRLLAPELGLDSCRSTDAKASPYWNHLLPSVREQPKAAADCLPSVRRLKSGLRLKSRHLHSRNADSSRSTRNSWPSSSISRCLLVNFEESILKGRFNPSGYVEGFTAEIGASGSYFPQHITLPVQVSYYVISEHSAPSPFLGVVSLESLGKKGYNIPKAGTIQVTLFNPNKIVVKMFVVMYDFSDMPVNHVTFLRHRIFRVPVEEGAKGRNEESAKEQHEGSAKELCGVWDRSKTLCYLLHLRIQSSKSGKIYLHSDIRMLFSRKSIEVDAGVHYELKSFTEVPTNPKYSPRV